MRKFLILFSLWLSMSASVNAYQQASGVIAELYVNQSGEVAVRLGGGFSSEVASECPSHNGYAGNKVPDPILKSLLLAAYVSKSTVKIGVIGCEDNWLKIVDVRGI